MLRSILSKRFFSTSKYAEALKKIPTVDKATIWINCMDLSGEWHRVPAYEGESLLKSLRRVFLPIKCSCQGGPGPFFQWEKPVEPYADAPTCNECHIVYIQFDISFDHKTKKIQSKIINNEI